MGGELTHVAFDIESTGFDVDDEVTVVGFELELGCRMFYQTGDRPHDGCEAAVRDRIDEFVKVSVHQSERQLVEAVAEFAAARLQPNDVLLVAYNGETWRGGFDLPFLRTRYAAHDVQWPFLDVAYADLLPIVRDLFNTTVDGEEAVDLETAYEVLCSGPYGACDPFADSQEAVTAFTDGRFAELVTHCTADVLRTGRLSALAQQYCSKSDFQLKSLTPTIHDYG